MNCRGWNPHIALYLEGDLERSLAQQLETHLIACEECRTFVDELRESQADLRQLKSEIVDDAMLNRVRGRVLDQVRAIERHRTWIERMGIWLWGGFRWRYAVLGCVALIVSAVGVWRLNVHVRPVTVVAPPSPQIAAAPSIPDAPPTAAARPRRLKPAPTTASRQTAPAEDVGAGFSRRVRESATETVAAGPEANDTLIQIVTDDPNVVIYWLVDEPGGF